MAITFRRRAAVALVLALPLTACNDPPFGGVTQTIGAEMVTPDTTLIIGEATAFEALAIYGIGPGLPTAIEWTSSDSAVATVARLSDGRGSVTARTPGGAWIRAFVNNAFSDSARVTVVGPGAVRWRVTAPAGLALYPAAGADSSVRVLAANGSLSAFDRTGGGGVPVTACGGRFGPSLDAASSAYLVGDACAVRLSATGSTIWSSSHGDPEGGLAIAADEAAVILHSLPDTGGTTGAVVVSRIGSIGEVWRDTLQPVPVAQRSAPVIGANGDIYVTWNAPADGGWLTRLTATGTVRWTMPLPAAPRLTTPALDPTRVTVSYLGGVVVFDTAGPVLWSRQFVQDNPAATDSTAASSPVLSRAGNVYVQTIAGLHAYNSAGVPLWTADSLGTGSQTAGVGAPAILTDTTVVVVVGGTRVCGVHPLQGVPRWCSPALGSGDLDGGVAVSPDRTIYVTRATGELIALWNRRGPEIAGWPAEGGNHQRTRRR